MRQQKPPPGTLFLVCTHCERAAWRRVGTTDEQPDLPICPHCGSRTVQRFPHTLALTREQQTLLHTLAKWTRRPVDDILLAGLHGEIRRHATERAGKGKPIPPHIVEWLEANRGEID